VQTNAHLFWLSAALCGYRRRHFFEYRLHPAGCGVRRFGRYTPPGQGRAALLPREVSATCPDEVSTVGLLLTLPDGTLAVGIDVGIDACYSGSVDQGEGTESRCRRSARRCWI
jgi:hypothetical protein